MAHHPPRVSVGCDQLAMFPRAFDVVRISLVIEVHNLPLLIDSKLQVYGGPRGEPLLRSEMLDVPTSKLDVFEADIAASLCSVLDNCVGPFR